jgi:hypothetical protein
MAENPQPPKPRRHTPPLLDAMGRAILDGKDAATFLWQVPDDQPTRERMQKSLELIKRESAAQGRREMPQLCEDLLTALRAQPSPQQVDILQDGFDRLYKLWAAAKSGLM